MDDVEKQVESHYNVLRKACMNIVMINVMSFVTVNARFSALGE